MTHMGTDLGLGYAQSLSRVSLFATLWTVVCQAPLSMGILQAEYWSGLPCPPPGDFPKPGIEPKSPALQVDSLLTEPPEKPKNTGVGSLSLLQGVSWTQESNWDLLHYRWILYQLSYQGSPIVQQDRKTRERRAARRNKASYIERWGRKRMEHSRKEVDKRAFLGTSLVVQWLRL